MTGHAGVSNRLTRGSVKSFNILSYKAVSNILKHSVGGKKIVLRGLYSVHIFSFFTILLNVKMRDHNNYHDVW